MDWQEYFLEHIDADDEADELRLTGIRERFLSPDETLLLTPTVLQQTETAHLCRSLHRLAHLVQTLPDQFNNRLDDFARALGYPESVISLLHGRRAGTGPLLGRWDLLQSAAGWRVLEWNLGGAVAGIDCSAMQQTYQRLQNKLAPASGQSAGGNGLDALKTVIDGHLDSPYVQTVYVLDDDDQLADSPLTAQTAAQCLARLTGCEVSVLPVSEFAPNGQGVEQVFEVFTLRDMVPNPERYDAYLTALDAGGIRSAMPLESELYMNKATLALLHENADDGRYDDADIALVRALVPQTLRVTETLDLAPFKDNRGNWVLKTATGYGGFGVTCGWEQTSDEWNRHLDNAQQQTDAFILQQRVQPVQHPIVAMTPAGDWIERDSAVVLGIFLDEDRFAGGLARASVNEAAVINAHNRAAVGVMRVD